MSKLVDLFVEYDACGSVVAASGKDLDEKEIDALGDRQFAIASAIADARVDSGMGLAIKASVLRDYAPNDPGDLVDGLTQSLCQEVLNYFGHPAVTASDAERAVVVLQTERTDAGQAAIRTRSA